MPLARGTWVMQHAATKRPSGLAQEPSFLRCSDALAWVQAEGLTISWTFLSGFLSTQSSNSSHRIFIEYDRIIDKIGDNMRLPKMGDPSNHAFSRLKWSNTILTWMLDEHAYTLLPSSTITATGILQINLAEWSKALELGGFDGFPSIHIERKHETTYLTHWFHPKLLNTVELLGIWVSVWCV